jgi:hypothetical protein
MLMIFRWRSFCPIGNEGREAVSFVDAVLERCAGFRAVTFLAILDKASTDNTRQFLEEHARQVPELARCFRQTMGSAS